MEFIKKILKTMCVSEAVPEVNNKKRAFTDTSDSSDISSKKIKHEDLESDKESILKKSVEITKKDNDINIESIRENLKVTSELNSPSIFKKPVPDSPITPRKPLPNPCPLERAKESVPPEDFIVL